MALTNDKIVYICLVGDRIDTGHLDIVSKARDLGRVVVGVPTDAALVETQQTPCTTFVERARLVENISGVQRVVPQNTLSYRENLQVLRPDYVVNTIDWHHDDGASQIRGEVIEMLAQWGGELVDLPSASGETWRPMRQSVDASTVLARTRQGRLRYLLETTPFVRIIEAHSALAAVIAHRVTHEGRRFDALWQSSLTDATLRAKPDIEIIDTGARLSTINEIFEAMPLPLIYDGDTGGFPERVHQMARSLDRAGVSALCLEDKAGSKRNSLYGMQADQQQADIPSFCARIAAAKGAAVVGEMMFISRIESLILGAGLKDAITRAEAYIAAGSDAILIHSIAETADEVIAFTRAMRDNGVRTPIFVVPTTYGATHEDTLVDAGINAIIYANHLLRAAYPRMVETARHILAEGRSDDEWLRATLATPKDVLSLIPAAK